MILASFLWTFFHAPPVITCRTFLHVSHCERPNCVDVVSVYIGASGNGAPVQLQCKGHILHSLCLWLGPGRFLACNLLNRASPTRIISVLWDGGNARKNGSGWFGTVMDAILRIVHFCWSYTDMKNAMSVYYYLFFYRPPPLLQSKKYHLSWNCAVVHVAAKY